MRVGVSTRVGQRRKLCWRLRLIQVPTQNPKSVQTRVDVQPGLPILGDLLRVGILAERAFAHRIAGVVQLLLICAQVHLPRQAGAVPLRISG